MASKRKAAPASDSDDDAPKRNTRAKKIPQSSKAPAKKAKGVKKSAAGSKLQAPAPQSRTRAHFPRKAKANTEQQVQAADVQDNAPPSADIQDGVPPPADAEQDGVPTAAPTAQTATSAAGDQSSEDEPPDERVSKPLSGRQTKRPLPDDDDDSNIGVAQASKAGPPTKAPRMKSPARHSSVDSDSPDYDGWSQVDVLDEIQTDVRDCELRSPDVRCTVRVELQVHKDHYGFQSRLGYRAKVSLIDREQAGPGEGEPRQVGYIHSWRIDKPTATHNNTNTKPWTKELLTPPTPDMMRAGETSACMRALFFQNGKIKAKLRNTPLEPTLLNNSLMFVEMVYVFATDQRRGILQHALPAYHQLLGALPEWYAFAGSIALIPAAPKGFRGNAFKDMADEDVEKLLSNVYQGHGYQLWIERANVSGRSITVMGRTIPEIERADNGEEQESA